MGQNTPQAMGIDVLDTFMPHPGVIPGPGGSETTLRISFDDISFCRYPVIFKISLKYRYRIVFENITRYFIMKYWSILALQWTCESYMTL